MNAKDAFTHAVHAYPGGAAALAPRMGMTATLLRNKACPTNKSNVINLDDADLLMELTGDHGVLHALAQSHGHVAVKVEEAATASDIAVLELVTQVWSANGEVGAEVHRTLADGIVEPHEVERVRAAVYRTQKALMEVVARLDGMVEPKSRSRK